MYTLVLRMVPFIQDLQPKFCARFSHTNTMCVLHALQILSSMGNKYLGLKTTKAAVYLDILFCANIRDYFKRF